MAFLRSLFAGDHRNRRIAQLIVVAALMVGAGARSASGSEGVATRLDTAPQVNRVGAISVTGVEWRSVARPAIIKARVAAMSILRLRSMHVYAMAALVASVVLSLLAGTLRGERHRRDLLDHDLRHPPAAVPTDSEAAREPSESQNPSLLKLEEILEGFWTGDSRSVEVVRRMKVLFQDREWSEEAVDINDLSRETAEVVFPHAAACGARIQTNLHSEPVIVLGDRVHLQQVLLNLVLNGLDALAHTVPEHRYLVVSTALHNSHAELSVKDGGSGIPAGAMRHMFEPFFSTKTEGTGMGLAIVRSIVQAHSGRIVAENNRDRGATFRVFLPLRHHTHEQLEGDRHAARG